MNYYTQGFARLIREIKTFQNILNFIIFQCLFITMLRILFRINFKRKNLILQRTFVFFRQNRCNIELYKSVEAKFWR